MPKHYCNSMLSPMLELGSYPLSKLLFTKLLRQELCTNTVHITSSLIQYFSASSIIVSQWIACITILHTALHMYASYDMYVCM